MSTLLADHLEHIIAVVLFGTIAIVLWLPRSDKRP
jgi:hypothetical protein